MNVKRATPVVIVLVIGLAGCADIFLPEAGGEGQPCLDDGSCKPGLVCNQDDICVVDTGEECESADDCDDGNPCTWDACESNKCIHEDFPDQMPCDDEDPCTTGDECLSGECSGQAKDCSQYNRQCSLGVCFPDIGKCGSVPKDNGAECDDGLYCTVDDGCQAGVCTGQPQGCDDGDVCTTDTCNESEDTCDHELTPGGDTEGPVGDPSCSNGQDDDCDGKVDAEDEECISCTDNTECDDENPCTADTCANNQCTFSFLDGTACNDGKFCTVDDNCQEGTCKGQPMDCSGFADACNDGVCVEENNKGCISQPKANGTSCEDLDFCTVSEQCQEGVCETQQLDCDDGDVCTIDACDEVANSCTNTMDPSPGDEGPTGDPTCENNFDDDCDGRTDLNDPDCVDCQSAGDCDDGNNCTTDACTGGICSNNPNPGATCNDNNQCTSNDSCSGAGVCTGTQIECDDGNVCTDDSCNPTSGCLNTPVANGTACSDTIWCNGPETCQAGACSAGAPPCSDDGLACTTTCVEATRQCNVRDPNYCVILGVCYQDQTVNPSNPCQECKVSNSTSGWTNDNTNSCDDGQYCNGYEECSSGSCQHNPYCQDDGLYCTECNGTTMECHELQSGYCLIGSACYTNGQLNPTNPCQECRTSTSTSLWTNDDTNNCDDGMYCSGWEQCSSGVCQHNPNCQDDGLACTTCVEGPPPACNRLMSGYCLIGGACYLDGAPNPANSCQECMTVSSTASWTDDDTNDCGDGLYCNGWDYCIEGSCMSDMPPCMDDGLDCTVDCIEDPLECNVPDAGYCAIDLGCYSEGDPNPMNPCEECIPSDSQTEWTPDDSNDCPGGDVCYMGWCCTPMCENRCCGEDYCGRECPDNCTLPDTCNYDNCECETSYSLVVHAINNAILMEGSPAAHADLPLGDYDVSVLNNTAEYAPGLPYYYVYISCKGGNFNLLHLSSTITVYDCQETGAYAFFTDTGNLADNSGAVTLQFTPTSGSTDGGTDEVILQVDAISDTIQLDASNAAYISLPEDSYMVEPTDADAQFEPGWYYNNVYISCEGSSFHLQDVWMQGSVGGCMYSGVYAFFTDTTIVNDNSGSVTLIFQ